MPLSRHRETPAEDPLEPLHAALALGDSLILFPEGTRGDGAKIQPFKKGLYHLVAKHPDVVLVPVYINNISRVLPKGEILPVPILYTVTFGCGFVLNQGEQRLILYCAHVLKWKRWQANDIVQRCSISILDRWRPRVACTCQRRRVGSFATSQNRKSTGNHSQP